MLQNSRAHLWPVLLLAALGLFLLKDLLIYVVKWDSLDQYLPFRYFLSYASEGGRPALWLPYQKLGYPVYGDMQSGFWYPFTWLHVLLGGYGLLSFNIELVIHIILAGIGMYLFGVRMGLQRMAALLMGISYMFCGHIIGTCHVYTFVISAVWLPYILSALLALQREGGLKHMLAFCLSIHLFVSGGYPAFSMILFYFLLGYVFYQLWKGQLRQALLYRWIGITSLVLLMGLGYLYAQYEVFPFMSRSQALPYNEFFHHNSFTLKHWWSFVFPFMLYTDAEYFASDLSMTNAYVGLFTFFWALYALISSKHPWRVGLLLMVGFMLAASAGPDTPLRFWLYEYVPGFDLFRHPALFRLFAVFGLIMLGGIGFDDAIRDRSAKPFKALILMGLIAAIGWIGVYSSVELTSFLEIWEHIESRAERSGLGRWTHLAFLLPSTIILLFGSAVIWKQYSRTGGQKALLALLALFALELGIQTWLSVPVTMVNRIERNDHKEAIDALPMDVQSADDSMALLNRTTLGGWMPGIWKNLGIWVRKTSTDGYNPFELITYEPLMEDSLRLAHGLVHSEVGSVKELDLGKDMVRAQIEMPKPGMVDLMQNPYPYWKVEVNGEAISLVEGKDRPVVALEAGSWNVSFRFDHPLIVGLFWLSQMSFLLILTIWLWSIRGGKRKPEAFASGL